METPVGLFFFTFRGGTMSMRQRIEDQAFRTSVRLLQRWIISAFKRKSLCCASDVALVLDVAAAFHKWWASQPEASLRRWAGTSEE